MTDQDALLAAIEAHPDDDLHRLVYADWLEEHARTDADRAQADFVPPANRRLPRPDHVGWQFP